MEGGQTPAQMFGPGGAFLIFNPQLLLKECEVARRCFCLVPF